METTDYRELLKPLLSYGSNEVSGEKADAVLATRIPSLCPDCGGTARIPISVLGSVQGFSHCDHRNAPTIGELLRWGENVARYDSPLTVLHAMDGTPVPDKYEMTGRDLDVLANAAIHALCTEVDR